MTAFLSITDLHVRYDETDVLRGVNLEVGEGDFTAIVGPSGCGKTTLLRSIAGLERAASGDMRLGSRMLTTHGIHLAPHKRNIGWVPQDASLFPHLTVAENIAFGLATSLRGIRKAARNERVDELLELVCLTALAKRMPHELSGGQAQRVALARALANTPALVLLDEPFAGLDPVLRSDLRSEVKEILSRQRTAALLVTHDQTEALSLANRVALMRDGIIEQAGSPLEVYGEPSSLWCAEFLGEANVVEVNVVEVNVVGPTATSKIGETETEPEQEPSLNRAPTFNADSVLGTISVNWMDGDTVPTAREALRVMVRPESLALTAGWGWQVIDTSFAGHDGLVTLTAVSARSPAMDPSHYVAPPSLVKVLVAARDMPALGMNYDVIVTGSALGYSRLG